MSDDFCLIHGYEHMRCEQVWGAIPYCETCNHLRGKTEMVTDHEMRMYSLDLFEILQAVDHTLTVHGHIDCGTPLHRRIAAAIAIPNEDPSGQRREPMSPHHLNDVAPFPAIWPLAAGNDGRVRLVDQNGTQVIGAGPACAACKQIPRPDCDNPACAFRAGLKPEPTVRCDWCGGTLLCRSPVVPLEQSGSGK